MVILEVIGIGVLLLLVFILLLYLRRTAIARSGGTIALHVRLSTVVPGRGWSPGVARFAGDELRWYRIFSFAPRPRRVLCRQGLVVEGRRLPEGPERATLPPDWVILRCLGRGTAVEIAMAGATVAGFLSWLEAAPPGTVAPRLVSN
ncbi:hypothetical protein GCM10010123_11390 [Pilimelia anulata]|uniref:DUF2550 family protein n=1 Tax=Pilimelia anulata TaxID=53371 RepID=A0A8J3B0L2_9ACTN|nr:DUF2550 domain-containing protein [Pilimelia anulata]GGJ83470.1 hypothetical protein GCM10010123_11390 [Pilimelia anulata]